MKSLNLDFKETVYTKQRDAKDNILIVLQTLRHQNVIEQGIYDSLRDYLKDIPDNPYEMLFDMVGEQIEMRNWQHQNVRLNVTQEIVE